MNCLYMQLLETVSKFGNRVAVNYNYLEYTYYDIYNEILTLEEKFEKNNIKLSKKVILHGKNSFRFLSLLYMLFKKECIIIPVDGCISKDKLSEIISDVGYCSVILDNYDEYVDVYSKYNCLVLDFDLNIKSIKIGELEKNDLGDNAVLIMYSSGSTGETKGIVCSQMAIIFAVSRINCILHNSFLDKIMITSPFSFDYGLYQVFLSVEVGAQVVINDLVRDNILFIPNIIEKTQATAWAAVPVMLEILYDNKRIEKLSCLRYISSTGDVVFEYIIDALLEQLRGIEFFYMYGLTECKRVSMLSKYERKEHRGSVGKALPGILSRIVDENNNDVKEGEIGELLVYGNNIMIGYYNDFELTNEKFIWDEKFNCYGLRTGDIFKRDSSGYLYFISRTQLYIKKRGVRISPSDIEKEIVEINGIIDAIVVPIHCINGYDQVFAFIRVDTKKMIDKFDVLKKVKKLVDIEYSEVYEDNFPVNNNGKKDRMKMIKLAEEILNEKK